MTVDYDSFIKCVPKFWYSTDGDDAVWCTTFDRF